jgi:IS30 family transposase
LLKISDNPNQELSLTGALAMPHKQLTLDQRYQIRAYMQAGFSKPEIASFLGVHKTTIYRELHRNMCLMHYIPRFAQMKADGRRKHAHKKIRFTHSVRSRVEHLLKRDFSPEQISGHLAKEHQIRISHETIYQHIWADKRQGGELYKHLRYNCHKRRRRYRKNDLRGQISGRVMIDERPAIVETRECVGDWEIDTLIGKNHKGALITAVERKTKYTRIRYVPSRKADLVAATIIQMLKPYQNKVFTITVDNGGEFSMHQKIAEALDTKVYFARPYHAWERGIVENTNGLIRQYFPKKTSLVNICRDQTKFVEKRLNRRPRKALGFNTPLEYFWNSKVAFGT